MNLLLNYMNTILKSAAPQLEETMVKLVIIAVILLLTVPRVCPACGQTEYLIGEECCAMCTPGYHVRRHCTEFTSTTCVPCLPPTFTDAPNGQESCMSCKICDLTGGLKVKRACSSTMNALCEPLEGHYCTDPTRDDCRGAVEHTKCKPGQYIKQPGTSTSDSICGDCVGDTYSDGSFTSCRPHTQCEVMGLIVIRKGSTTSDTECGERKNTAAIIAGVISFVILFFFLIGVPAYLFIKKRKQPQQDIHLKNNQEEAIHETLSTVTEEKGNT